MAGKNTTKKCVRDSVAAVSGPCGILEGAMVSRNKYRVARGVRTLLLSLGAVTMAAALSVTHPERGKRRSTAWRLRRTQQRQYPDTIRRQR